MKKLVFAALLLVCLGCGVMFGRDKAAAVTAGNVSDCGPLFID